METTTTIQEIGGSYFILIPAAFAEYYQLRKSKGEVKIKDTKKNVAELTFPLW